MVILILKNIKIYIYSVATLIMLHGNSNVTARTGGTSTDSKIR